MTLADEEAILDHDQVVEAVQALKQYMTQQHGDEQRSLAVAMEEALPVQLQFTLKKVPPQAKAINIKIQLPNRLVHATTDVCLFVRDLNKNQNKKDRDYEPTIRHYKKLLREKNITAVTEVMPLKRVKLEFGPYEARRNLANMYDVFLADAHVIRLLPEILGKQFYGRKKIPVQVNLEAVDLVREMNRALDTTLCSLSGKGSLGVVRVADSKLTDNACVENIMAAAQKLCASLPGGAKNISKIHLRTTNSPALPIYMSDSSGSDVVLPEPEKRKFYLNEPEEVSTVIGGKVRVTARGDVQIIREKSEPIDDDLQEEAANEAKLVKKRPVRGKKGVKSQKAKQNKNNSPKVEKKSVGKKTKAKKSEKSKPAGRKRKAVESESDVTPGQILTSNDTNAEDFPSPVLKQAGQKKRVVVAETGEPQRRAKKRKLVEAKPRSKTMRK